MLSFSEKIREIKRITGMPINKIADALGESKESLYKWSKGTRPIDKSVYKKVDGLWKTALASQNVQPFGGMPIKLPAVIAEPLPEPTTFSDVFKQPVTSILTLADESFEPLYRRGWKLLLAKVKDLKRLHWGSVYYFVDHSGWETLQKVLPGDDADTVRLCSCNEKNYPIVIRHQDDFAEVFAVVGILITYEESGINQTSVFETTEC